MHDPATDPNGGWTERWNCLKRWQLWRTRIAFFEKANALVEPWWRSLGFWSVCSGRVMAPGKCEASEKPLPVSRPTARIDRIDYKIGAGYNCTTLNAPMREAHLNRDAHRHRFE